MKIRWLITGAYIQILWLWARPFKENPVSYSIINLAKNLHLLHWLTKHWKIKKSPFKIIFTKLMSNNHLTRMPTKFFFYNLTNKDVEIPRLFLVAFKCFLTSSVSLMAWMLSLVPTVALLPDLPLFKLKDIPFNWYFTFFCMVALLDGWRSRNATLNLSWTWKNVLFHNVFTHKKRVV